MNLLGIILGVLFGLIYILDSWDFHPSKYFKHSPKIKGIIYLLTGGGASAVTATLNKSNSVEAGLEAGFTSFVKPFGLTVLLLVITLGIYAYLYTLIKTPQRDRKTQAILKSFQYSLHAVQHGIKEFHKLSEKDIEEQLKEERKETIISLVDLSKEGIDLLEYQNFASLAETELNQYLLDEGFKEEEVKKLKLFVTFLERRLQFLIFNSFENEGIIKNYKACVYYKLPYLGEQEENCNKHFLYILGIEPPGFEDANRSLSIENLVGEAYQDPDTVKVHTPKATPSQLDEQAELADFPSVLTCAITNHETPNNNQEMVLSVSSRYHDEISFVGNTGCIEQVVFAYCRLIAKIRDQLCIEDDLIYKYAILQETLDDTPASY